MKTPTLHVDETQYMPYETDMDAKRKAKTPEYQKCPYGCGASWYTKAQAKKCTCQISLADRAPKRKPDPVRTPEQIRKMAIWERRFEYLEKQIHYRRHIAKKQASPKQAI